MPKVQSWSEQDFKRELCKRLKRAKKYREQFESGWRRHERTCLYHNSRSPNEVTITEDNVISYDDGHMSDVNTVEMSVNYCWRFLRYIHSQMSTNAPSVVVRPTSTDEADRLAADAADRIVRFAAGDKDITEIFDQCNLKTLLYGTGWIRVMWDASAGDTLDYDESTGELTMAGDIAVDTPSTWNVWIDPDARAMKDIRWVFECIEMPAEEAKFLFADKVDDIERFVRDSKTDMFGSELEDNRLHDDTVLVYRYVEKGLPINGMAGRIAWCLEDGTLLSAPSKNTNPGEELGYVMCTDIDVPDQVYGASFIQYIEYLQELLNRLDSSYVENIAAHNVVRFILPEGAQIEDESISNSAWDYCKITGNSGTGPYFVPPAQLMPDAVRLRDNLIQGIQEMAGVNDSMTGQVQREMSGFAIQTAVDHGNQTRARLFNKYRNAVCDVYRLYLGCARKHWDEPRTILVLGKERAFQSADFCSADITGGYDVCVEYGASLSLDPSRRREEIMQLMPIFEKAGVPTKTILGMLKLNELEGMYDRMTLAAERQREIFETMVATDDYVKPAELQDHAGMLDYAYYYLMTAGFRDLALDQQDLVKKHVKEREQMAAQSATKGQAPAPPGGAPPPPAGPPGAPMMPPQDMPLAS